MGLLKFFVYFVIALLILLFCIILGDNAPWYFAWVLGTGMIILMQCHALFSWRDRKRKKGRVKGPSAGSKKKIFPLLNRPPRGRHFQVAHAHAGENNTTYKRISCAAGLEAGRPGPAMQFRPRSSWGFCPDSFSLSRHGVSAGSSMM